MHFLSLQNKSGSQRKTLDNSENKNSTIYYSIFYKILQPGKNYSIFNISTNSMKVFHISFLQIEVNGIALKINLTAMGVIIFESYPKFSPEGLHHQCCRTS